MAFKNTLEKRYRNILQNSKKKNTHRPVVYRREVPWLNEVYQDLEKCAIIEEHVENRELFNVKPNRTKAYF